MLLESHSLPETRSGRGRGAPTTIVFANTSFVAAGFAIVRDRLLGFRNRHVLALEDVRVHPASDHVLVRLDRVVTQGRSTQAVPSDQGFLKSSLTVSSSRILRRSLARGGRKMYLQRVSRPCMSLAATLVAPCRLNPCSCAHNLPFAMGWSLGSSTMRMGLRLLAGPAGGIPAVAAPTSLANSGSFSPMVSTVTTVTSPSPGAVTRVMTPRRRRNRRMRLLARSTTCSTSCWVGAGAGWNIWPLASPSGEYTPSRKMVCRCKLRRKSLLARWMTVTAPVSPGGKPRSTCRRLYHPATVSGMTSTESLQLREADSLGRLATPSKSPGSKAR